MKKVAAVAVGFLVAFAPAGTAFAGVPGGNAWGNCKNSAGGGVKTQLDGSTLKNEEGLGGFKKPAGCAKPVQEVVVVEQEKPGDTSTEEPGGQLPAEYYN